MPKLKNPPQPRVRLAPLFYSICQTSDALNQTYATTTKMLRTGELPFVRVGGRRKVPAEIVLARAKIPTS